MERRGYRVYYVDPEEDINSLIAELGQKTFQKIALVVHQRSNIFNSLINIQLLQKYSKEWQKELVFISTEMRLIRLSLEANIKIYPDLEALELDEPIKDVNEPLVTSLSTVELLPDIYNEEASEVFTRVPEEIPMYRSRRNRKRGRGKVVLVIMALAILFGLGWFYLNFSIVTVEVTPVVEKFEQDFEITCDYDLQKILFSERKIPLETAGYEVNNKVIVPTTGEQTIGFTRAEGKVILFNNNKKEITVPTGTIVKTSNGIKFKTVQKVTVPAMKDEYSMGVFEGSKVGKTEVNIVALNAGSQGNVATEEICLFEKKGSWPKGEKSTGNSKWNR